MDHAMVSDGEGANDDFSTLPHENKLDVWNGTFKPDWWNGDDNVTQAEEINPFYFYETEQLAFLWILFVLIVVGNAAVLLALSMSKARKSRMNYFIMHLAIADLSVGLISVLTDVIWKITVSWNAGNAACKIIRFAQVLVTYSSTYVLVALSIDRYDAITHPMNFTRGWRRARILIATAWLVSGLFAAPTLLLYEEKLVDGKMQCWIELSSDLHWQVYITLVTVALFVLPALLISACYVVIVHTIWSKSGAMVTRPAKNKLKNGIMANQRSNEVDDDQDSRRASSRGIIPKAKIKTVKMTFVIVFMFILCWSPYFVYDLVQVFGHIPRTQTMTAVSTFIQSMAPLNSAANPLIYCLFSTHICRNLRKIPAMEWLASKLESAFRLSRWIPCLSPASASSGEDQFTRTFRTTTTRLSSDVSLPTVRKNLSRIETGVSVSGKRGPSPCSMTRISGTTTQVCGQHANEPLLVRKSHEWV